MREPPPSRTRRQYIITKLPGVKTVKHNARTAYESWKLFFYDSKIDEIVRCTNEQLLVMSQKYIRDERDCPQTDFFKIQALLGVLYLADVRKNSHLNLSKLWEDNGTAPDFFVATRSKKRYQIHIQAVRFDEKRTRHNRVARGNLAPIRHVFEEFVKNVKKLTMLMNK